MLNRRASLAWPTLSARRDLGRRGVNFALFSENATKVELCLFDSRRRDAESRVASRCPSTPTWSGTATARRRARASSTATACTARTTRRTGHRFNPNKVSRSVRQGDRRDRCAGTTRCSATRVGDPDADLSFDERDSAAVRAAGRGRRRGVHLGRRPAAAHAVAQDAHLRVHVKGFTKLHPDVPEAAARHLRRRWRPSRRSSTCTSWASPPSSCCRCITTLDDRHLDRDAA